MPGATIARMYDHPRTPLPVRALLTILFARTVINLDFRIVYPFLPAIARGLGISLEAAGVLVAVQGGVGLVAPLFGPLSDRYGRRRLMEAGLLLLVASAALIGSAGDYLLALIAFAGFGIAKALYDPAMQAYIGDAVPYARRGRVMAVTELAWSFAWLIGVPVSGLLIEWAGWNAPWWLIAALSVVGVVATRLFLPPAHRPALQHGGSTLMTPSWFTLLQRRTIAAALLSAFAMLFAIENVFIVYGAFLERRFGLAIGAIGLASVVLGVTELAAEAGAAAWTDRLGKRRSVIVGFLLFAVSLLVLPFLGGHIAAALGGFAIALLFFEFTIVSLIPLVSELAPEARATLLAMNVGVMGLGRMLAPVLGTSLFNATGSILLNSLLSALVCFAAAFVMWRWVEENGVGEDADARVRGTETV